MAASIVSPLAGIQIVMLGTNDLDAAMAFYEGKLGLARAVPIARLRLSQRRRPDALPQRTAGPRLDQPRRRHRAGLQGRWRPRRPTERSRTAASNS